MKQSFGIVKPSADWHLLSIECEAGRLRIYVDDACLGETRLPPEEAINGLRCDVAAIDGKAKKDGRVWIDELIVAKRMQPMHRPPSVPDQDSVWHMQGDQLLAALSAAMPRGLCWMRSSTSGSLAWTQLRGIFFAQQKAEQASAEPEITFRPCPGFPVDCLRAKLLRWEDANLIVQHELFGEVAIERERLDKIRFAVK